MQQPLNLTTSVGGVKGRVKVFVRPRPFDTDQMAQRGGCCLEPGVDNGIEVTDQDQRLHTFHFDRVFSMDASNRAVYEEVGRPLVDSVLTGFNGTLMAYGQTGTGKTHTVGSEDGLIACMVQQLFDSTANAFRITLSYQQVYQERLYDLLRHPSVKERALPLRECTERGVFVEGLSEHAVTSSADVFRLLAFGRKRLHFAETKMNRHSSRSHAVCTLSVERIVRGGQQASSSPRFDPHSSPRSNNYCSELDPKL